MAFSNHDIVPDSPTNNFAVLNGNNKPTIATLSNGNLNYTGGTSNNGNTTATLEVSSGKYYCEMVPTTLYTAIGVTASSTLIRTNYSNNGGLPNTISTYQFQYDGNVVNSSGVVATFVSYTTSDIIGVLLDMDNRQVSWYKNGTIIGTISGLLDLNHTFFAADSTGSASGSSIFNFGQDPTFGGNKTPSGGPNSDGSYPDKSATGIGGFFYEPPAGAKALCTANLPEMTPTVNDDAPKDYFNTFLYDASGSSLQQFAHGFTFTPDFLWIKNRSSSSGSHWIYDRVRGFTDYDLTAGKGLSSASSAAEGGDVTLGAIIEPRPTETYDIDTHITIRDGNSAGVDTYNVNYPGHKYVVWGFRAGGAPTADNSNTSSGAMAANSVSLNGTLQSNYTPAGSPTIYPTRMSINTDAGFSIVKYGGSNTTGLLSSSVSSATIPHGLNDCEFCIIKNIRWTNTWVVSHRSIAPNVMSLQDTGIAASTPPVDPAYGQITTLGSNTVTITRGSIRGDNVGEDFDAGGGQFEYIMYCWHSVEGYSKFGSYTGNGSTDGPFVYCGFRPAWVMVKEATSAGNHWSILDSTRDPYNGAGKYLYANLASEEDNYSSSYPIDFLSGGFKIKTSIGAVNNNQTYIFMAFAEQPFKYANAR